MPSDHTTSAYSRVFLIDGRARPSAPPVYQGLMKAGAVSWAQGDITLIRRPDPNRYGKFQVVGKVVGEAGNPETTLMARYNTDLSTLFALARRACDFDAHVHMGVCQNPSDFNRGWTKKLVLEAARVTNYGISDVGALDPSENAVVNEEVPIAAEDMFELANMSFASKAAAEVFREVVAVRVCDTESCGECGTTSDGCRIVFAISGSASGSPGLPADVVWTDDGGLTWTRTPITTLGSSEDPTDADCVGDYLVVISNAAGSISYAPIADILAGTAVWTEITTGFQSGGEPNAMHSLNSVFTMYVGDGGYIYFSEDPTAGVEVLDAGSATAQNLNDIHILDELRAVAVGESNAVVATYDGGLTWQSIVGPAVGIALNTVWMKSELVWLVGTANGRLWYTEDGGTTWTEKGFPGNGAGAVRDIEFANATVGYMAHNTVAPAGRILRTTNGGFSWYVLPEAQGALPANDYIRSLAVCSDLNTVYAGGLGANAIDGIILKGSGA